MNSLIIEGTKTSPKIVFDPNNSKFSIEGKSYMENSMEFFKPILDWLEDYTQSKRDFQLEINVEYLNSSSTKMFWNILHILQTATSKQSKIEVIWYYDSQNDFSLEIGEELKDSYDIPIHLKSK